MTCGNGALVLCPDCGDWACATHGGHVMEKCECWPCDDCGDLFPMDELETTAGPTILVVRTGCRGCAKLDRAVPVAP